ncbi:hypothetical protein BDZ91DRAFT_765108 [Kalaharituber pfeilii]|nr:hypothetical protein BDZ91DRAFT_765108 [Kalaharituber pfeilii]
MAGVPSMGLCLLPLSSAIKYFSGVFAQGENDEVEIGTLKLLAEGAPDLTALIGLFVTDSVEKYAINYSKGHSTGMLKAQYLMEYIFVNHHDITNCVRPILGVRQADKLPSEELVTVHYMTKEIENGFAQIEMRKKIQHTEDSGRMRATA